MWKLLIVLLSCGLLSATSLPKVSVPVPAPPVRYDTHSAPTGTPGVSPVRGSVHRFENDTAFPELFFVLIFALVFFAVVHLYREHAQRSLGEPVHLAYELVSKSGRYGTVASPRRARAESAVH